MAFWEVTGTILPKLVMTHRFTPMRSDMGQGGDCCWAFATAVYSRTSGRSGIRRLWHSLCIHGHQAGVEYAVCGTVCVFTDIRQEWNTPSVVQFVYSRTSGRSGIRRLWYSL